jgi:hypothetical protein
MWIMLGVSLLSQLASLLETYKIGWSGHKGSREIQ